MEEKKQIEFKVLKKNKYGHRFILEPKERIKFREKCKYNKLGTMCDKGYKCYVDGGVLTGCTANVNCPRLDAWDKRHGLERPYTMVENAYPELKPTTITWHYATESPGKKRFVGAFIKKGRSEDKLTFQVIRYLTDGVRPCECCSNGHDELCVAWTDYNDFIKGITPKMIKYAKLGAWSWWKEDNDQIK